MGIPLEMQVRRHYRDAAKALLAEGFTILSARCGGPHLRVRVRRGDQEATITVSSSPAQSESAVKMIVQTARRQTRPR